MLSLPSVCTLYKYMCFTSFLFTETNNESKATWLFSACLRCTTEIMGRFFESIFFAEPKLANELFILHFSSTSQIMCIKKHFVYEPTIFEHQKNWLWNQKRERKKTKPHRKLFPIKNIKYEKRVTCTGESWRCSLMWFTINIHFAIGRGRAHTAHWRRIYDTCQKSVAHQ